MLTVELYKQGIQLKDSTKYTIDYSKHNISKYLCIIYIQNLLDSEYIISAEDNNKLQVILNNLKF